MMRENPPPEPPPEGTFPPPEWESLPFDAMTGRSGPPEILTMVELERILEGLEQVEIGDVNSADDFLQGAVMVLGLGYAGDVQMLVLRVLQLYREVTQRR